MWFLGSVTMGVLHDFSLLALVIFGVMVQAAAAALFFWLQTSGNGEVLTEQGNGMLNDFVHTH